MSIKFNIEEIEYKINEFLIINKSKKFSVSDIMSKIREWYPFEFDVGGQMGILQMLMKMVEDGRIIK